MAQETKEVIKISDFDKDFKDEIQAELEGSHLYNCYQCGICSSGCIIAKNIENPPHRIIEMAILGLKDKILSDPGIWICSYCHTCTERCPKDVQFSHLLSIFRNMAAEAGYAPEMYKDTLESVNADGAGVALIPSSLRHAKRIRNKLGLPEIRKIYVDEIQKIIEYIKIREIIGSNKKKGDE
ncbi:MAG: hypothetical protein GF329_21410 [Candidatus Lokiarchaeota archaeon]|nr:hypothetical protein [Candidatus Lokiarchaeota archaeon]